MKVILSVLIVALSAALAPAAEGPIPDDARYVRVLSRSVSHVRFGGYSLDSLALANVRLAGIAQDLEGYPDLTCAVAPSETGYVVYVMSTRRLSDAQFEGVREHVRAVIERAVKDSANPRERKKG